MSPVAAPKDPVIPPGTTLPAEDVLQILQTSQPNSQIIAKFRTLYDGVVEPPAELAWLSRSPVEADGEDAEARRGPPPPTHLETTLAQNEAIREAAEAAMVASREVSAEYEEQKQENWENANPNPPAPTPPPSAPAKKPDKEPDEEEENGNGDEDKPRARGGRRGTR